MNYETYYKKKLLVDDLDIFCKKWFYDIKSIEYRAYSKNYNGKEGIEEFILLTWNNGGHSYANNNINSLSATAQNVLRMVNGGVYENIEMYENIMEDNEWQRIV